MHYQLEIIMPRTEDIDKTIAGIMRPFSENCEGSDECECMPSFWDWYVVGGRFAGSHEVCTYPEGKLSKNGIECSYYIPTFKISVSSSSGRP